LSVGVSDEGTSIVNPVSTINFKGTCVNVADAGSGQADVTVGQKWVIASHSGAFEEIASRSSEFYYGDMTCGWDSCNTDVNTQVIRDRNTNFNVEYVNIGIPSPYNIETGDRIEVCGIAYCPNTSQSNDFRTEISLFSCSATSGSITVTPTNLSDVGSSNFDSTSNTTCFSNSYVFTNDYSKCDTLFLLGFQLLNLASSQIVKYSYTFKLTRGCAS
jgi:hypothetical protein